MNNAYLEEISIVNSDTTILIARLQPNKQYSFIASLEQNKKTYKSKEAGALTMDTTSHNFTWQKYEFGDFASSYFDDVAIIDDNDIWAVGQIWLKDSTGYKKIPFNAAHWDGNLESIESPDYGDTGEYGDEINTIYAFNKNDIWTFTMEGTYSHWNGTKWKYEYVIIKGPGRKLWGTSASDLYLGLDFGQILHYDGNSWTNIPTGTDLNINDIYGAWNKKTNQYDIMAVASNILESHDKQIIKISANKVSKLPKSNPYTLSGVWLKPNNKYYAIGAGVYQKNNLSEQIGETIHLMSQYITPIVFVAMRLTILLLREPLVNYSIIMV